MLEKNNKIQRLDYYLFEAFCGAVLTNRTFYNDENTIYLF